ncbi:antibiotic biosynthesis monooxygenase [candidate division GN15 bacterium]|nr:antibiotic biosynthesis monooxygenase [candidate division GN15 bacterium]
MFVAINYITCRDSYRERFEELMTSRKGAIDKMDGFRRMQVLRPNGEDQSYLIMSEWDDEASFKAWTKSEAFIEGHKRGFADLEQARKRGEEDPMTSRFCTYEVIAR